MKAADLRKKTVSELRSELDEAMHQQFKMRMKHGSGQLPQIHLLKQARRDVARLRTVIDEKIRDGEGQ